MTTERSDGAGGDKRPLVILVSSGYHRYREYLLDQVSKAARVWLFLAAEPTWEAAYIDGYTVVDTLDVPAMIAAARDIPLPVDGVVCWDEVRMVSTASLQQALGLPGSWPEAVVQCRDKHCTRTALAAAFVPQPASFLVTTAQQAASAAGQLGYPVICKPRALGASFGVCGVSDPGEIEAGYAEARGAFEDGVPYYEAGVLVEEYVTGEEISVDCAVADGTVTALFVARKMSGFPPYFEETGHSVDPADPLLSDRQLLDVLHRAHHAVGYQRGITHTELRLTSSGPKVIEINARLGGDLIPHVAFIASGVDAGATAVRVATGGQPAPVPPSGQVSAIYFLYPERDCVATEVTVDHDALPAEVRKVGILASAGQELLLPPAGHVTSRYAYVIVAAETIDGCHAAYQKAASAIRLHARPLQPGEAEEHSR